MKQDFFIRFFLYVSLRSKIVLTLVSIFSTNIAVFFPVLGNFLFSVTSQRNNDIQKINVELVPFEFNEVNRGLDVKREGREIKEQNHIKVT